jgi:hypothetical protein
MAFVIDEGQQQGAQGQAGSAGPMAQQAPMTTSAPGAGPGKGTGTPGGTSVAQQQPFTNLQAYLTANAPQINNQGQQVANQLSTQYGQATGAVDQAAQNVQGQVTSGTTAPDQALVNQAAQNPTQFVTDPNNVAAFQKQLAGGYSGPANMEGTTQYGTAAKAVQDAVTQANQVGTTSGLENYVRGTETNPTQGESMLDTVLLQGNPNAMQTVQNAAQPFAGLNDYLGQATTKTDAQIQKAINDAQTQAQAVQAQFTGAGGVVPAWEQGIQANVTAQQAQAQQQAALDKQVLTSQGIPAGTTPAQMNQIAADFGMSLPDLQAYLTKVSAAEAGYTPPTPGTSSTGSPVHVVPNPTLSPVPGMAPVDLTQFATFQTPQYAINPGNVATSQDYAEQQALTQLLGNSPGFLNPANASQAGTASTDLLKFSTPPEVQAQIDQILRQIALQKAQASPPPSGVLGIS